MVDAQSLRAAATCRRDERTLLDAAALVAPQSGPPGTGRQRELHAHLCAQADLLRAASEGLSYEYTTLWEKEATDAAINYWSHAGQRGHLIDATNSALLVIRHLEADAGIADARRCAEVAWYIGTYLKGQAHLDFALLTANKHEAAG